ncbi:MAG: tetratricopeptide repeat protein [Candidatus Omnitrophica bacterium]|nr:tetratricopeptide repeat protein [Candidatus Omnitrophota bacterium]
MKQSQEEYIAKNIGTKTARQIADELGLRERSVSKYLRKMGLREGKPSGQRLRQEEDEKAPVIKKWVHVLSVIVIAVLVLAAYSSALNNDFIWDDEFLIRDNTAINSFNNAARIFKTYLAATSGNINNFYRPIQELSYMIDRFLWGSLPLGFHLTNILLHALCAVFLYILSLKIFKNWLVAFVTASLFGIHPINTEAVTYVAGRADPLYLLFFLISFILFLRAAEASTENKGIRYVPYALSILFYAASVLSKEIGMILPLFFILYIFVFSGQKDRAKLYSLVIPYLVVFLAYVIMRKTILDFSAAAPSTIMGKFNLYIRMLTTFKAVCVYLFLLALPFGLHMERQVKVATSFANPEVFIALAAMSVIAVMVYIARKRSRKVFFASLWFFIGLLPVSNIVPINSFISEHWLYLPAIGIYMMIGLACARFFYKPAVVFLLAGLFLFFGILTFERNKDWKDGVTFFKNTIKYSPNNARLRLNFGNVYSAMGREKDAMAEYKKALELRPDYAEAYSNIASIYLSQGNYAMAGENLKKALSIKPNFPNARKMMDIIEGRGSI